MSEGVSSFSFLSRNKPTEDGYRYFIELFPDIYNAFVCIFAF